MKILAIENYLPRFTDEDFMPHTKAEASSVWECTSSELFGQNRGISKRDFLTHKLSSIIHLNSVEMMHSSL